MTVCGAIIVLPRHKKWQTNDAKAESYCHRVPYLTAFAYVVIQLVCIGVAFMAIFLVGLLVVFAFCISLYEQNGSGSSQDQAIVISRGFLSRQKSKLKSLSMLLKDTAQGYRHSQGSQDRHAP